MGDLSLKYGELFERLESVLRRWATGHAIRRVRMTPFELQRVLG